MLYTAGQQSVASRDPAFTVHETIYSAEQDKYFLRKTTSFFFSEQIKKSSFVLPLSPWSLCVSVTHAQRVKYLHARANTHSGKFNARPEMPAVRTALTLHVEFEFQDKRNIPFVYYLFTSPQKCQHVPGKDSSTVLIKHTSPYGQVV